jgi:hypothetical protein
VVTPDPSIDNLDDSYYGMNQFKMGDMYVGFMNVLHQVENTIDVRLMFSRDGINWEQTNHRQPWLSPSPGAWDGFMVNINSAPVLMGDEMYVYYGGANCRHDWWITGLREGLTVPEALNPDLVRFGLGVARMRRDGFVSLDAGSVREGVLITRTVRTELLRLSLNAVCRRAGFVKVEVTDADDRVIPGFSREECDVIDGDSTNAAVTWRGKREIPHGGSLRLRLFMRDASLYSFMFS